MAGLISVFVEFVDFRRTGKNTEYGADSVSTVSTDTAEQHQYRIRYELIKQPSTDAPKFRRFSALYRMSMLVSVDSVTSSL